MVMADGSPPRSYTASATAPSRKERVESFGGGRVAAIEDFKTGTLMTNGRPTHTGGKGQDKGQTAQVNLFIDAICHGGAMPIPSEDPRRRLPPCSPRSNPCGRGWSVPVEW